MKITKNEKGNDIVELSEQESAELIVILDNADKIPGLEEKYIELAAALKKKLWQQ